MTDEERSILIALDRTWDAYLQTFPRQGLAPQYYDAIRRRLRATHTEYARSLVPFYRPTQIADRIHDIEAREKAGPKARQFVSP